MMKLISFLLCIFCACSVPTTSSTPQFLGSVPLYYEPTSYGAISNDGQPDRVAFQQAVDEAALGGTVFIGPGVWEFNRSLAGSYNRFSAINTHGHDVTIRCSGPEAVLMLVGDQGGTSTILLSIDPSAQNIRVTGCTFSSVEALNTDEQTHAIATTGVSNSQTALPIYDVEIDHIRCDWPRPASGSRSGDCIRLLGDRAPTATSAGTELYGVNIHDNTIVETGRSGVEIQRGVHKAKISRNNMFCSACDQLIDGEATGVVSDVGRPSEIIIEGNTLERGGGAQGDFNIALTWVDAAVIQGNTLRHGGIASFGSTVQIVGNNIYNLFASGDEGLIQINKVCTGTTIVGNRAYRAGTAGPLVKIVPLSGNLCNDLVIADNVLIQGSIFHGIYLESASGISIRSNHFKFIDGQIYSAIYHRAVLATPVTGFVVDNNTIMGPVKFGVTLDSHPGFFGAANKVSGNVGPLTQFGIHCNNADFSAPIVSYGNSMGPPIGCSLPFSPGN